MYADQLDFKNLTLEELKAAQDRLQNFLNRRLESRKREALTQIQNMVRENDLPFDDVVKAIRITAKRGKAPAIYRNPKNPRQTWSGKGDAPIWYTSSPDPESLRIPGA